MTTHDNRSNEDTPGPRGAMLVVFLLLGLASVALIGPWHVDNSLGRVALGFATVCIFAAYGTATWAVGNASGRRAQVPAPQTLELGPILERLDRILTALETRPAAPAADEDRAARPDIAAIAAAISERRWPDAEALLDGHPDDPEMTRLRDRLGSARHEEAKKLSGELEAARSVGDPDRVLEIREGLEAVMPAEEVKELDATLVKWFLALIMKRLRAGTVRADVADLAAKVAERFAQTVEGASLRASLPTLRRSAGLCPRCARPYRGIADACPICLAAPPPEPSGAAPGDVAEPPGWQAEPDLPDAIGDL
jgi:hypothetical protein